MTRTRHLLIGLALVLWGAILSAQTPIERIDAIKADLAAVVIKLDALRVQVTPTIPAGPTPAGTRIFTCTFANAPTDCGFGVQQKTSGRASIVQGGRDGTTAVRLLTMPGDSNVAGSGSGERTDLSLSQSATGCYPGREQWWEHSIYFPTEFQAPPSGYYVVMDFHGVSQGGQANFHVDASRYNGATLGLRGYGGKLASASDAPGLYQVTLGSIVKGQWYDFVYHVKWSSGSDGYFQAWVNGVQKLDHQGPTLYLGTTGTTLGCYLKLANYHDAFGQPSAVIHDRVIRWDVP